jgi:hypothetical protein
MAGCSSRLRPALLTGLFSAVAERLFPPGLQCALEVVPHPVGGVGVQATHAGDLVAEALLGEARGMEVPSLTPKSADSVLGWSYGREQVAEYG